MTPLEKIATSSKRGCLMLLAPSGLAKKVLAWSKNNIPESDLAGDGYEEDPHITILYGFDINTHLSDIKSSDHWPDDKLKFNLGKIKRFKANANRPDSDAIFIGITSKDLTKINAGLKGEFDVKSSYEGYTPHLTLAYVKPGSCSDIDGQTIVEDSYESGEIMFSSYKVSDDCTTENVKFASIGAPTPLYDWDGTMIPRLEGDAETYIKALQNLQPEDVLPNGPPEGGPIDLATARPELFHEHIREAAERIGLKINDIYHAPGNKVDVVEEHQRPLVDDDPDVLAAVREAFGEDYGIEAKQAASTRAVTGPDAISQALQHLDLDKLEAEQKDVIKRKLKSKRPNAVKVLNIIEGMRRNGMKPSEFLINKVPVIPAVFRPFSVVGNSFVPGDANELYKDLFELRSAYSEERKVLGMRGSGASRLALYDTIKALYGYGDPVKAKTKQRGVSGMLKKITGTSPKFGFVQRKLLSKPQDNVSRGTIAVDPDLTLDEIGVPYEQAWTIYAPYIQRRLIKSGYSPKEAVLAVRDRDKRALYMLEQEVKERPVIYSRAPSWHKFNVVAGKPKLIEGNTISISPLVTTGLNADFDGDAMHLHVPSQDKSVKEAWEKLLPSKMLFSARESDKVVPVPKQELILGLYTASKRTAKKKWQFPDQGSALKAIQSGSVAMSDEVEFPGMESMQEPVAPVDSVF